VAYVKNHALGFTIPYGLQGHERRYAPDFIARVRDPELGEFYVVLEVTGRGEGDGAATAKNLWIPAVNHDGSFGRWEFVELTDPEDTKNGIRQALERLAAGRR
jgi:type III restriction enzyme